MKEQNPPHDEVRPAIAITHHEDEGTAVRQALAGLPLDRVLPEGSTVVLVPNWVKALPPESGTVVGPGTLRVVIEELRKKRPGRLVVAAGSAKEPTPVVFERYGYDKVVAETGSEFVDLNHGPFTEVAVPVFIGGGSSAHGTTTLRVNELYDQADALVSFTQIKVHEEAVVSLGLKNVVMSWMPAELHGFPKIGRGIHEDLHAFISAAAWAFPVSLSILSGCPAMVGTGPSGGKAAQTGIVVAGTDPVAVDVVGARLLGFRPQAVGYLHQLIVWGFGQPDLRQVKLKGMRLDEAERVFTQAAYGTPIVLDKGKILPVHLA